MSTDKKGMKILARTFFNQLRSSGYTQRQIIELSTELLDLVSTGVREGEKDVPAASTDAPIQDWRQAV